MFIQFLFIGKMCTSCKIMTIPAHARGKLRTSIISKPLDEIQVDTVPNPEPMSLSADTRINYFLIFCDHYSRLFYICGIRDKSTDTCIDGIELIISNLSIHQSTPQTIRHVRVMLDPNSNQILLENGVVKIKFNSPPQPQNIKNKMV